MTNPKSNRVAVVTGSSSGIGRAIALQLACDGFDVIVHYANNRSGALDVCDSIKKMNRRSTVVACDFNKDTESMLSRFATECWTAFDGVHVWVNNAGIDVLTGTAAGWSFDTKLKALLDVDVVSTLVLSRAIGRLMRERHESTGGEFAGSIINMGWDQADQGMAGDSGQLFAAAKGAIMAISKSLAQSFAPAVRVNCLAPGWIRTAWGHEAPASWQFRARRESLLDRWGTAEDVAGVASFLASDASKFVNAQIIPINGGFQFGTPEKDGNELG